MVRRSRNVFGGRIGFIQKSFCPGDHMVLVVIKDKDSNIGVIFRQLRTQMKGDKVRFRLGCVSTRSNSRVTTS